MTSQPLQQCFLVIFGTFRFDKKFSGSFFVIFCCFHRVPPMGFGQNFEKYFVGLKTCLKLLETILDLLGIVFSDFYFFKKMSHFFQVLAHRAASLNPTWVNNGPRKSTKQTSSFFRFISYFCNYSKKLLKLLE